MAIQPKKIPIQEQAASIRRTNFLEVCQGYNEAEAVAEARRCLQCKHAPCIPGCPVGIDIPAFIKCIAEQDYLGAIKKLKEKNNLPAICGRVCPQETQCEGPCTLGKKYEPIAIGKLERFAADWEIQNLPNIITDTVSQNGNNKKVAVVGSGPAGLTAAADLARLGYGVSLFEALHEPGGVLIYGIPEFRLPKSILSREVQYVQKLGVDIHTSTIIGVTLTIEDLVDRGFNAVFIGTGAGLPYFLNIPGENYNGVYSANEFLTRVNLMRAYQFPNYSTPIRAGQQVAVIGAGNTAMDAARSALRLGAKEVTIVYRRSFEEMPARIEEVHHAEEEGIQFKILTAPVAILGNNQGWVAGLRCQQMQLGEPDSSGRRRPVPIKGAVFEMEIDTLINAIGQGPNPLLQRYTPGLNVDKYGRIVVNPQTFQTSIPSVYAGGDIATGEGTVIAAMGNAKVAACSIDEYLKNC
ncbi:MAG: NADPH-dependent glutamate synthase [bacterium]